jgi:Zn-dependent peptidase ImmA (M78 family)/transcriptional regulator with XRE-family HTH domain
VTDTTALVGRRIKEAREAQHWSQGELARRLGLTQTAISYWESGKRSPGLDDLVQLAHALERDVSFFFPSDQPGRPSIRAVLRATAERLDRAELDRALQGLVDDAERNPAPPAEFRISPSRGPAGAARELLQKAGAVNPPVDVEKLARRCGVRVLRRAFEDDLSGLVIVLDDGAIIGVNEQQSKVRQRFTIAHELAHYVLGHHDRFHIDLGPSPEHGDPPGYDWRSERAANEFAAELLMPTGMMLEASRQSSSVPQLARTFKVSELAMGYRLVNLQLR